MNFNDRMKLHREQNFLRLKAHAKRIAEDRQMFMGTFSRSMVWLSLRMARIV